MTPPNDGLKPQRPATCGVPRGNFSSFSEHLHNIAFHAGLRNPKLHDLRIWDTKADLSLAHLSDVRRLLAASVIHVNQVNSLTLASIRELQGKVGDAIPALNPKSPLHWYAQGESLSLYLEKGATLRCVSDHRSENQRIVSISLPPGISTISIREHTFCRLESSGEGAAIVAAKEPGAQVEPRGVFLQHEGHLPELVKGRAWEQARQDVPIPWDALPFLPEAIRLSERIDGQRGGRT